MLREQVFCTPPATPEPGRGLGALLRDESSRGLDQDKLAERHRSNARAFPEQLAALWRQGRADFLHVLLHAFPDSMPLTREAGTPGEPTPQLVTEGLTGRHVDLDLDR